MLTKTQAAVLWALTALSFLLFLPASYLGLAGIAALSMGISSPFVLVYVALWLLLPVLCVAGPVLGWRSARAGKSRRAFTFAVLPFVGLALIPLVVMGGHLLLRPPFLT